jgi:acyl-CoA reductase-like NAD-dependent aldehyde dehydrogenase
MGEASIAPATPAATPARRVRRFVAGAWLDGDETFEVRSPVDGGLVATVARARPEDVDHAVESALSALPRTASAPAAQRARWCGDAAGAIAAHSDELALAVTREQGKALREARAEVAFAVEGLECFQREALAQAPESRVVNDPNKRVFVLRQPRGVWAVLTPWNFPVNIPIEYLGPAIATGSPVVWKPAPTTTAVAALLLEVLLDGGLPPELVNLVPSDGIELAQYLVQHPGVACVGLTGGPNAGRAIAQAAWDKHLLLELGGNGPTLVFADVDVEKAAGRIAAGAFFNAGQACSAAGRILVHRDVADALAEALVERAREWPLGDPTSEDVAMGPLHLDTVADNVRRHVADAVERGARVLVGGDVLADAPTRQYFRATVLDGVSTDALVNLEETFGPVAAIVRCDDDEQLLEQACSSRYGLAAAIYTESLSRAFTVSERLPSGTVVVNDTSNYWEHNLPFGGWAGTLSGRGRLGGRNVLDEFTQTKSVAFDLR